MFEGEAESLLSFSHELLVLFQSFGVTQAFNAVGEFGREFIERFHFVRPEIAELFGVDGDDAQRVSVQRDRKDAHRAKVELLQVLAPPRRCRHGEHVVLDGYLTCANRVADGSHSEFVVAPTEFDALEDLRASGGGRNADGFGVVVFDVADPGEGVRPSGYNRLA